MVESECELGNFSKMIYFMTIKVLFKLILIKDPYRQLVLVKNLYCFIKIKGEYYYILLLAKIPHCETFIGMG